MEMVQTMKQQAKTEVTPIPTIYEEELIKTYTILTNILQICQNMYDFGEISNMFSC